MIGEPNGGVNDQAPPGSTAAALDEALRLAGLGYPVFPCNRDKEPRTAHGFKDAVTDPETVRRWWSTWPDANPAVPAAGLLIVDLDPGSPWIGDRDRDGALLTACGAISNTPRGGTHFWFRRPAGVDWRCSAGQLDRAVDIRTTGGYVLVPPGVTADGRYSWSPTYGPLATPAAELPLPPDWLGQLLDRQARERPPKGSGQGPPKGSGAAGGERIPEGTRNGRLASIAGAMRRQGASREAIEAALLAVNEEQCSPPLPEAEVRAIARSIGRYPPGPGAGPSPNGSPRPPSPPSPSSPSAAAASPPQGWEVIRDFVRGRYDPTHRVGGRFYSRAEHREVTRPEVTGAMPPELIGLLATAANAPTLNGSAAVERLPGFFKKWAPTAYAATLDELPDEDSAAVADLADARGELRQLVREALYREVTLSWLAKDHLRNPVQRVERRSLIHWARLFAGPKRWESLRSKAFWFRDDVNDAGEVVGVKLALRHELFSQVRGDRRLTGLPSDRFTLRAERYGIGRPGGQADRPGGKWAIVLDGAFIRELTGGSEPDRPDDLPASPRSCTVQHADDDPGG